MRPAGLVAAAFALQPAREQDFEELLALRIAAMRESLEQLHHFDPERARSRLRNGFKPECTWHIAQDGQRVGFCVLKQLAGELKLEHLYIHPQHQGRGIGGAVLQRVLRAADSRGLPLQLAALKASRSNAFYQRHGLQAAGEAEWDVFYRRAPDPAQRLTLELPDARWADSYRTLVAEFEARGEKMIPFPLAFAHADFPAMLQQLADCALGIGIPEHFIAHSTFWLVRGGEQVLGVSNLRHGLTPGLLREGGHIGYGVRPSARGHGVAPELLRLTLHEARAHGIERALLTCAEQNRASARTILRNGGVFDSQELLPERGEVVQRYWVPVPPEYAEPQLVW